MGCFASRDTNPNQITSDSALSNLFQILSDNHFNETVLMTQTLFNYSYSRQTSQWFLKRKINDIYTMNSFHLLEKNIPNQTNHEPNFDIQEEKFVIRPPNQRYPQQIEKYIAKNRIMTVLLSGDRFPDVILAQSLFSNNCKSFNLGNNGKFTFIVQWNYTSQQSRRAFHRFHQLFKHRWSRYINDMEFYGLCKGNQDKEEFEKEVKKRKWNFCTHLYSDNDHLENNDYYLPHQIFNCCMTDDLQGIYTEEEDILIIINPKGYVMRAEKPQFCCQAKDNMSDTKSNQSDQIYQTQESHQKNYEKLLERDIKKACEIDPHDRKSVEGLSKRLLKVHSITSAIQPIKCEDYKELKQLFLSQDLQNFLKTKQVGEPFQFELEKWKIYTIYHSGEQKAREASKIYTLPKVYPTSSPNKENMIPQIFQQFEFMIPTQWRSMYQNYPRYYTVQKNNMMEEMYTQLKDIKMEYLQLFLEKTRSFEYQVQKIEYYDNQKWQDTYRGFFYDSEITKIDNVPVGQENYSQYSGLIKYAQEAEQAINSHDECPVIFQGLEPLQFQLITDFYLTGISTEINIGSKYVNIPYCTNENYEEKEIPFKMGLATLFYLVDWSEPDYVELLKLIVNSLQDYLNVQANSGVQKSDQLLSLRIVVLSNRCQEVEKIEGVEIWQPISDYYMENKEYVYEGLLTKFFGMDTQCNTMMLYNQQGILKWRGGVELDNIDSFKQLVDEVLVNNEGLLIQQEDIFFQRIPEISCDDTEWQKIKKLLKGKQIQLPDGTKFRIESVKYKLWEKSKHQFKDYITKPKLYYEGDDHDIINQIKQLL